VCHTPTRGPQIKKRKKERKNEEKEGTKIASQQTKHSTNSILDFVLLIFGDDLCDRAGMSASRDDRAALRVQVDAACCHRADPRVLYWKQQAAHDSQTTRVLFEIGAPERRAETQQQPAARSKKDRRSIVYRQTGPPPRTDPPAPRTGENYSKAKTRLLSTKTTTKKTHNAAARTSCSALRVAGGGADREQLQHRGGHVVHADRGQRHGGRDDVHH
jgi:hypothetical protein